MEQFLVSQFKGTVYEKGAGWVAQSVMRDPELSDSSKAIYAYLCSFAWGRMEDDRRAHPSAERMKYELGMGHNKFYRHLKPLKDKGYVKTHKLKEGGKFDKTEYEIVAVLPHIQNEHMEDSPHTHFEHVENEHVQNEHVQNETTNTKRFKNKKNLKQEVLENDHKDQRPLKEGSNGQSTQSNINWLSLENSIASDLFVALKTYQFDLPTKFTDALAAEIRETGKVRGDYDLKEVEALYQQFKSLIDNDYAESADMLSEGQFTNVMMSFYKNAQPTKYSFKGQLLTWFNNKFDFKKQDEYMEYRKNLDELDELEVW